MSKRPSVRTTGAMLALVGAFAPVWSAPAPPDLTRGGTNGVDRALTYNLGATGLRGWIHTKPDTYLDSVQGRTTAASRQILVTHVGKGTPADGVMNVDDVILGAGGRPFADDARKGIAVAIQAAETESGGGILRLTRWRAGRTEEVRLKLRVMGTYSRTAPYDCPKSRRILDEACKVLEGEPMKEDLWGAINGLALLATGKPEHVPRARDLARRMAPPTLRVELKTGMVVWDWGYRNLFLCEYFLLTGDREVLHAIREYTRALAKGQSLYGTFGHGISERTPDGRLHGSIPPYGPVNTAGLIGNLAIVMGRKCGVTDPEVDAAIDRASRFFGYFVDKGSIPYGEHLPWPYHENNGKNAMAAAFFAAQGNRDAEARYFAKMVTASYANREYGHTGQGFSYLWSALGANVGGPAAAAAFFGEASWHFDLVRRCDGSFTYDGGEQYGAGKTHDNTYHGRSSYYGLNPNATYVLTYALPLKKLHITGRDAGAAARLGPADVAEAVASGRFDVDRATKSAADLTAALGDWSPVVRGWAAEELARRPEARSMVPNLVALAEGRDARVRQGACETLGLIRDPAALPVLVRLLRHEDRWLRFKAANALKKMGDRAKPVLDDMLKAVVAIAEPPDPIAWADPVQLAHGELAEALFGGLLRHSIKDVDPALLHPAIRAVARNPDGMARMRLRHTFENLLTADDVQALAPEILDAVMTRCPADTMFGNEIRMGGFKALTKFRFKEGIEAGVHFARTQGGHGSESRTGLIMKEIAGYGSAARDALPALRELIGFFHAQCEKGEFPRGELNDRRVAAVEEAIRVIGAATDHPALRSVEGPRGAGDLDLAAMMRPAPETAKFADPAFNIWCGTMVRGDDGRCHLLYSRWRRELGHSAWVTHSEVAHAVADSPLGPYRHVDVALPPRGKEFWDGLCTHNPTVMRFGGKYYLYYMGNTGDGVAMKGLNWTHRNNQRIGVAVADRPEGPWTRFDRPLIDVSPDPGAHDALMVANPSVTRRPDGGYLMIYKAVARKGPAPFGGPVVHLAATSDSPTGPFHKHPAPVFTKEGVMFPAEDPFVWCDGTRYHAVVKDMKGHFTGRGQSLALFGSADGLDWTLAAHPFVAVTEIAWKGGAVQKLDALERPQIWLDGGRPAVLFCAAAEAKGRDGSFNVAIPLGPAAPVEAAR
jgi:hypothetical protein